MYEFIGKKKDNNKKSKILDPTVISREHELKLLKRIGYKPRPLSNNNEEDEEASNKVPIVKEDTLTTIIPQLSRPRIVDNLTDSHIQ